MKQKYRPGGSYLILKRGFDIIFSFFALTLTLAPMLLIMLLIRRDSKGPALFRQKRIGRRGKPFICYKFRTMSETAPDSIATDDLADAEDYITRIGKLLRKTSLDEMHTL